MIKNPKHDLNNAFLKVNMLSLQKYLINYNQM